MLKFLFWVICALCAAYFVNKQIKKYYENLDKPLMSFKKFNRSPNDKYPAYTICFESMEKSYCDKFKQSKYIRNECRNNLTGVFLNEKYLRDYYNLSRHKYENFLRGVTTSFNRNSSNFNSMDDISFEKSSKGIGKLISSYEVVNMKGSSVKSGLKNCYINSTSDDGRISTEEECPFFRSYQDSDRLCLTRRDRYMPKDTYASETIDLNRMNLKFAVYIHYPGQGLRTFFKRFQMQEVFGAVLSPKKVRLPSNVMFQLSGIKLLRKRTDGNDHCKEDNLDDARIFEQMINQSACVPTYWKQFKPQNLDVWNCKNISMLSDLRNRINDSIEWKRKDIVGHSPVPCQQMSYGINMEREGKAGSSDPREPFRVRFVYLDEHYLEIQNERDFGWDMCWANIGGYVGLFLGISLLHVSELLSNEFITRSKTTFSKALTKNTKIVS